MAPGDCVMMTHFVFETQYCYSYYVPGIVIVVVSHIQRIGYQPEKNYFTRWPIPLVVC